MPRRVRAITLARSARYAFPSPGATLISLEALQVNGSLALYAIFKSGEVVSIDPQTGATTTVANLLSTSADGATVSGALTVDPEAATMCVQFGTLLSVALALGSFARVQEEECRNCH
jgi:hypothetical protein